MKHAKPLMNGLETKVPPVLVMFVVAALMYTFAQFFNGLTIPAIVGLPMGAVLVLISLLLVLGAVYEFRKHHTTVDPTRPDKASELVTSGVFTISRNPMYVAMMLCLIGFGFVLCSAVSIMLTPLFVLYINRYQIDAEERAIESLFGASYLIYKQRVRRWL